MLLAHSILGATDIYNMLPQYVVDATSTKQFQHRLQALLMEAAFANVHGWQDLFSPRLPLHAHMLKQWYGWSEHNREGTNVHVTDNGVATCVTAWLRFAS